MIFENLLVEIDDHSDAIRARVRATTPEGPQYGCILATAATLDMCVAKAMLALIGKTNTITFEATDGLCLKAGWYRKRVTTGGRILSIEK